MTSDLVREHYEAAADRHDLVARVARAVDALAPPIAPADLAAFDQFHVRGLAATAELGVLLQLQDGDSVLDAGSGLGGPSRFLAATHRCRVTGVDLSPAYVAIAELLAERTGLSDLVDYEVGDLARLGFPDRHFDAAYTQHVMMNIRDRVQAYREIRRVVKPGGRFAFYDVLRADGEPAPVYPLPWAETEEISVLLTDDETRADLAQAGLSCEAWLDVTPQAIAWFAESRPASTHGLGLAMVLGPRFGAMSANFASNLREGRLRLIMASCALA